GLHRLDLVVEEDGELAELALVHRGGRSHVVLLVTGDDGGEVAVDDLVAVEDREDRDAGIGIARLVVDARRPVRIAADGGPRQLLRAHAGAVPARSGGLDVQRTEEAEDGAPPVTLAAGGGAEGVDQVRALLAGVEAVDAGLPRRGEA